LGVNVFHLTTPSSDSIANQHPKIFKWPPKYQQSIGTDIDNTNTSYITAIYVGVLPQHGECRLTSPRQTSACERPNLVKLRPREVPYLDGKIVHRHGSHILHLHNRSLSLSISKLLGHSFIVETYRQWIAIRPRKSR
jgi:hypothetical protein